MKSGLVLYAAMLEDVITAGLDECAQPINNGSDALGSILELCSDEFRRFCQNAPLIIAMGQSNNETLSEAGERIFAYCK